ncbi:hypothetical protein J7K27_03920 [Candidatus Bathyarchaeota archaeon]|nr:hypothetical protein [Candidatus Bathyarchaeota archaeon]
MAFEPGMREVGRIIGLKQVDRRKLWAIVMLAVLVIAVGIAVAWYYGVLPGIPYTGAATLTIFAKPAPGLGVTADKYLGPCEYYVLDPTDNSTIASGSITADDDWQVEVDIEAGHPGYVWLAVLPPNNTYYLWEKLGDESTIIDERTYFKVPITEKEVSVTAYFVKVGDIGLVSKGDLSFTSSIFTTNVIYNMTPQAALYNLTLMVSFNVSGLKIDSITLNGTTVSFKHVDSDRDDVIDANEKVYIWLSGQDFVINKKSTNVTYVIAITFSNATIDVNETIAASMTFFAYKFNIERPFDFDKMTKITLVTATAYYTKTS